MDTAPKTSEELTDLIRKAIFSLMYSENLGDVHDAINLLHDGIGLPRPEGNFLDGWTVSDLKAIGQQI